MAVDPDADVLRDVATDAVAAPSQAFVKIQRPLLQATVAYLYRHIKQGPESGNSSPVFLLFHEEQYHKNLDGQASQVSARQSLRDGSPKQIAGFILDVLRQGNFFPAEFLISVYYIARFKEKTEITLHLNTWRPLFLTALLIADKMWEDRPVKNSSLSTIFPVLAQADLNKLELKFLLSLEFKVAMDMDLFKQWCELMLREAISPEIAQTVNGHDYMKKIEGWSRPARPSFNIDTGGPSGPRSSSQPIPCLRKKVKNSSCKGGSLGGPRGSLGGPRAGAGAVKGSSVGTRGGPVCSNLKSSLAAARGPSPRPSSPPRGVSPQPHNQRRSLGKRAPARPSSNSPSGRRASPPPVGHSTRRSLGVRRPPMRQSNSSGGLSATALVGPDLSPRAGAAASSSQWQSSQSRLFSAAAGQGYPRFAGAASVGGRGNAASNCGPPRAGSSPADVSEADKQGPALSFRPSARQTRQPISPAGSAGEPTSASSSFAPFVVGRTGDGRLPLRAQGQGQQCMPSARCNSAPEGGNGPGSSSALVRPGARGPVASSASTRQARPGTLASPQSAAPTTVPSARTLRSYAPSAGAVAGQTAGGLVCASPKSRTPVASHAVPRRAGPAVISHGLSPVPADGGGAVPSTSASIASADHQVVPGTGLFLLSRGRSSSPAVLNEGLLQSSARQRPPGPAVAGRVPGIPQQHFAVSVGGAG